MAAVLVAMASALTMLPAVLPGSDSPGDTRPPPLPLETSLPGVFAAGDVRAGSVKRVASAVGEGSVTIGQAHQHLQRHATQPSPFLSSARDVCTSTAASRLTG
jgi:NADPH-dependent glutamate synthase beta subunit-like oxidoreductase